MRVLLSLIKTNLNINFGISALKYRFTKEKKRLWEPILVLISIILGLGTMIGLYSFLLMGVYIGGESLGVPEMVLTMAFVTAQLLILIFGIFYIMSSFYFSKDMNLLIPLPIKPGHVMIAKFFTILVNEYLIAIPLLMPALIIYGIGVDVDLLYWFKGIILVLTAPVLPLVIAALFVIILMRFVNISKSKDLLMVIGSLLGILVGVGINFFAQRIPEGNEKEFMMNLIENNEGLIRSISDKFPPALWATYGLSKSSFEGLGYFILFVGISLILFAILIWLGNHIFYKGFLAGQEVNRKAKTLTTKQIENRSTKASSPVVALFWKEWKLFIRTPIYAMNGLAGMFMVPLFMLMPLFAQESELSDLLSHLRTSELGLTVTLGALAITLFTSSLNIVACTAVSREGSMFWVSKLIPISPKDQVLAKLIHSTALSLIGVLVVAVTTQFILGLSLIRITALIILSALGSFMLNIVNLIIDVLRPKLEWNNPQEAVKQNMNALFGMLLSLLILVLLAGFVIILMLVKAPEWLVYLILGIVMGIVSIISLYGLFALAERRYTSIEA